MLRFVTAGESHGHSVVAILEGLPHGLALDTNFIDQQLARRQGGYGRGGRMGIEHDKVEVLAGTRCGRTIGSPLLLSCNNRDYRIHKTPALTQVRPGHADLAGCLKHNTKDARDILERASARETCARVLAGSASGLFLKSFGIHVFGYVLGIGSVQASPFDASQLQTHADLEALRENRDASACYCLDPAADQAMAGAIDQARAEGDSLGGLIEVRAFGLPPGLGSHTSWQSKLDGRLAQACMSVQAMKAVEIGLGKEAGHKRGSQVHDPIKLKHGQSDSKQGEINALSFYQRPRNSAGGLEGGITTGEPLVVRVTMKPIATLMKPLASVDLKDQSETSAAQERSDTCAVPAASVVLESMVSFVLAQAFLEKFGGDSMVETKRNFEGYRKQLQAFSGEL